MKLRIQRMPSGSRPLTGSSNIRICGSPSIAAAMPSRCDMPSEKPLIRLPATSSMPVSSSTSSTRRGRQPVGLGRRQQVGAGGPAAVDVLRVEQRADLAQRRRRASAYGRPLTSA